VLIINTQKGFEPSLSANNPGELMMSKLAHTKIAAIKAKMSLFSQF
jgi:hypothetical protein